MSEERLQRILARAGIASRRKAEEMIREGRVTVNGQVAEIGGKADSERDAIKLDGKRVQPHTGGFHYLLLNKPKAVMSTVHDPEERPTVMDYVPATLRKALVPVGRLDFNTEGLIILTDDGDFAQHVAHPRYGGVKVYEVKVKGRPAEAQIDKLRAGIPLDGRRTSPCRITPRYGDGSVEKRRARARAAEEKEGENSWWTVELAEGRTRQIREMFYRIGHGVLRLRRVAIGPLRDPNLPVGSLRELTETEVEKLRKATSRLKKPASAAKASPAPKPAVKRAFPPPGTQKVDRSRPWREEKPKVKALPVAVRTEEEPARPAARKPAKKTYGPPARKASGKPSRKPARKPSGKPAGKPSSRPGGKPSRPKRARKPGGGASRAGRRGR
ncbi:MAG TPA: pseudouridine synthase [Thermoanaerobaculia bacterium]|jgi:23S rRNA pseudouridine2605 synthase|nr:pseudouridine synthase [Thermoanaerobaculia bacterium]